MGRHRNSENVDGIHVIQGVPGVKDVLPEVIHEKPEIVHRT